MNKTEMAKNLAKKTDLTQAKAAEVIDAIFSSEPGNGIIAVELDAGRKIAIAGFIIRGDQPKTVLIRGRGPSVNVEADLLPDPRVILKDSSNTTLADNDNWKDAPNWQDIEATGKAPPNDLEAAILISLDPGPYTVRLQGTGGVVGVGIVEVLDQTGGSIVGN